MATLVAIAYAGQIDRAAQVAEELETLPFSASLGLDDAVSVTVDSGGRHELHQSTDMTGEGALDGALVGLVAGVVLTLPFPFLAPFAFAGAALAGSAIGALTGGVIGHYQDIGIHDDFVRDVTENLPADSSALFLLIEDAVAGEVLGELANYGGELLTTDLPDEQAERLRAALHGGKA
jgi:uncharacterized membrane protein